jgi:hypothetical protein
MIFKKPILLGSLLLLGLGIGAGAIIALNTNTNIAAKPTVNAELASNQELPLIDMEWYVLKRKDTNPYQVQIEPDSFTCLRADWTPINAIETFKQQREQYTITEERKVGDVTVHLKLNLPRKRFHYDYYRGKERCERKANLDLPRDNAAIADYR